MNQITLGLGDGRSPLLGNVDYDQSLRNSARTATTALGVLVFGFGLAAAVLPVGGSVVGQGQLGVETQVKRIAHPHGGVISAIYVHDGQRVAKGQLLMRLDTSVSGVNADLSGQSVDQLTAERARLLAEQEGQAVIAFPSNLAGRNDPAAQAAMATERRLLSLRLAERAGQRAQLSERVRQLNQQIAGYRSQIAALQQQKALIEPERNGVRDLWKKGLVTISRLNQLERTAAEFDGSIASLQANIAQTAAQITETREQSIAVDQNARSKAGTDSAQITSALNDQRVRTAEAADAFERSAIRAPYDGIVDQLAFSTVGGVIQPAETIMQIVPANDQLVVEAAVSPTDIDRVRDGQAAHVRLSAFSMQTTPEMPGHVTFVSPERVTNDKTGASYYRVRVRLDQAAVRREHLALKAGMPAEMFISTGSRSLLSYVLKPLRDQFARAFNQ